MNLLKKALQLFLLVALTPINAQTIAGNIKMLANKPIKLEGYNGFNTYPISNTIADKRGNFQLSYSKKDEGMGYLISAGNNPLFVVLSGEDIEIVGESLNIIETIRITKGQENKWFEQYAKEHPRREQALNAWFFLGQIYNSDSLFSAHSKVESDIISEKERIKKEDEAFLASLPKDSYVQWFLSTRKLVNSTSSVAQYRQEEIPETIEAFRVLDYADHRIYKSGLFKEAIESHFWLLENSGHSIDSVVLEMEKSIDALLYYLVKDNEKLNEVSAYLFDLLERHSLNRASEYLAIKALNETSCTLHQDIARQFETYRAMKKGNTTPDIVFEGDNIAPSYLANSFPQKLSDIKTEYTLLVFAAGWCSKCQEEIPQMAKLYSKWKENNVEVILISLDEQRDTYLNFVKDLPFMSTCDFKKWESPIVNDYYVFGTPTMFLLNKKREILLRPNSVNQMDAWVNWFLIQEDKRE
jgi:thiol-disulfide isomerase/thioredoxin